MLSMKLGLEAIQNFVAVSIKLTSVIFTTYFEVVVWNAIIRVSKLCPEIGQSF